MSKSGTLSLNTVVNFGHTPSPTPAETVPRGLRHDCGISSEPRITRYRCNIILQVSKKSVLQAYFSEKRTKILEWHFCGNRGPRNLYRTENVFLIFPTDVTRHS